MKKTNRIFIFILIAVISLFTKTPSKIFLSVNAETLLYTCKDGTQLTYQYLEDDTIEITGLEALSEPTAIDLPTEIDGKIVTSIGDYAFASRFELTSISLPAQLKRIGIKAFNGDALIELNIPESVIEIGEDAFTFCDNLKKISVNEKNTMFSAKEDVLLNADQTKLIRYPVAKEDIFYQVPSTVIEIGDCAFQGLKNLQKIVLPDGLKTIETMAFFSFDNTSLKYIDLPDSVEVIGAGAFEGCTALETITIPNAVTTLTGCTEMHASFGKGVVGRFADCSNLSAITIPNHVIAIDPTQFAGCTKLTDIYYLGTEMQWKQIDFTPTLNIDYPEWKQATVHFLSTSDPDINYGDVNTDGIVDLTDAIYLNKYLATMITLTDIQTKNADVYLDGNVTEDDTDYLMQFVLNIIDDLPVQSE